MTGGKGIALTIASGAGNRDQVNLLSGDNNVILESGSSELNGGSGEDILRLENSTYIRNRVEAINGTGTMTVHTAGTTLTLPLTTRTLALRARWR